MYSYSFDLGVGTHLSSYPNELPSYVSTIKDIGFNSIRDEISWQSVEQKPGVFSIPNNVSKTDAAFNELSGKDNISSVFILSYGNNMYTKGGYPNSEIDIEKFSEYVSWVVKRYKGKIKYYEIWNEWLLGTGVPDKKSKRPGDAIYLELIKTASHIIRKEDPSAIIITGSINPLKPIDRNWMYGLVNKGLLNYVDGLSIHPYSFQFKNNYIQSPEGNISQLDLFESALKSITGKEIPLYITEVGYPTSYFLGGVDFERAGIDTLKYSLLAKSRSYIKGVWWYDLIDDGSSRYNREHHFGLLKNTMVYKPSSLYLKEFSALIINSTIKDVSDNHEKTIQLEIKNGHHKDIVSWSNAPTNETDNVFLEKLRSLK